MAISIPLINDKNGNPTDIISHLLTNRIIYLSGEINDISSELAITQLLYLDSVSDKPITMYINSPGGYCVQGLGIIDVMHLVKSDVNTVCVGECASMGAVILSQGSKRYALPHSEILIHQPLGGTGYCQASDIAIHADNILKMKHTLTDMLANACKQPYEKLEKMMDRDCILNANEALELGLIDKIL